MLVNKLLLQPQPRDIHYLYLVDIVLQDPIFLTTNMKFSSVSILINNVFLIMLLENLKLYINMNWSGLLSCIAIRLICMCDETLTVVTVTLQTLSLILCGFTPLA